MKRLGRGHRWIAGLLPGLVAAGSARAQDLPPALPTPPSASPGGSALPAPLVVDPTAGYPVARPNPPVVLVPPGGPVPTWFPEPIDPIAIEKKHSPGFVRAKSRSWHWRRLQGKLWGYPEEYEPRPLGASLYDHAKIMTANAAAARLTLFRYDFVDGSAELSPRGLDELSKIAAQLSVSPYPLIIERTPDDPALAEARRYAVLSNLARGACPVPSTRVLVGVPIPTGMSGSDAYIIGNNSIGRTQQYGPPIPLLSNGVNSPSTVTTNPNGPNQ